MMVVSKTDSFVLIPTGFFSWGANMTYKIAGKKLKVNFGDKAYSCDVPSDMKGFKGFVIDGKKYLLSDFKEV